MRVNRFNDFINESKLNLLLEATINFSKNFIKVLNEVDSPISKKILDLESKEVDINQNYIDINIKNSDFVTFRPDDKVGKVAKVFNKDYVYTTLTSRLKGMEGTYIEKTNNVENGQIGRIVKEYTLEDICKFSPTNTIAWTHLYNDGRIIVVFEWVVDKEKYQALFNKDGLITGSDAITPNDISLGRYVRALLKKAKIDFTDKDIEDFVYKYRSNLEIMKSGLSRFLVVKGQDIRHWYNESQYETPLGGTLGNSCMRYNRCSSYFGIYEDNNQVSLLLLKSDKDPNKICGRAILWETSGNEISNKVMDRIYTIKPSDEQLFKDWANENGYWTKEAQNGSSHATFIIRKDDETHKCSSFVIELDVKGKYDLYPYMDTFKFYSPDRGEISNDENSSIKNSTYFTLEDTDGGDGFCGNCGGSGRVECYDCDGEGETRCGRCDGDGTESCDNCSDGLVDCSNCDGSGEVDGDICPECDGSASEKCSDCDGDGEITCIRCDGDTTVSCYNCDGEGNVSCPEC